MPTDPVIVDVVEGSIESALREIEIQVERTARSANIREIGDHVPAIFDAQGRVVGAVAYPAHLDPIFDRWTAESIRPGDIFLWNHPYLSAGGIGHLPDLCLVIPVFHDGTLVAFVTELAHVHDIGGMVQGSISAGATEIFQEGLLIPPVKLVEEGRRNEALFATILANTRFPEEIQGDLDALINGCAIGVRRIEWLCRRYGADAVRSAFDAILDRGEQAIRESVLSKIPNGSYSYEDFVEWVEASAEPRKFIKLKLTLTKTDDAIHFDYAGSADQVLGSLNQPLDGRYHARALMTTFKALTPDLSVTDGVQRVITVSVPDGSVLAPRFPAATGSSSGLLLRCFTLVIGCLARALNGQVPLGADSLAGANLGGTHPASGRLWIAGMSLAGGSCGRPDIDGNDAVHPSRGRNLPVEYAEAFFPVRFHYRELRPDSAGAGEHRGGFGSRQLIEFLAPTRVRVRGDRSYLQPTGINGGSAGLSAQPVLNAGLDGERALPGRPPDFVAQAGERLLIQSAGGGGWGDPLDRDPALVERDLRRGLLTEVGARQYGVVPGDSLATEALRDRLRSERGPLPMFDRGDQFRAHLAAGDLGLDISDSEPLAARR